jgi:protein phosphatase
MTSLEEAREFEAPAFCATRSDAGTERKDNEDACGAYVESEAHVVVAVADGVSGEEGAAFASRTAVDVTLKMYRESPKEWGPAKRLNRAVQQANIQIHDRTLIVPELRRMATTLTAIVLDGLTVHAAHVGDTRLYSVRGMDIVQRTKDHSVAGRKFWRSARAAKDDPDRSLLTRSLGRDLIVAVDRITFSVARGDVLVICSDGLYTVMEEQEIAKIVSTIDAPDACGALIESANARGTADNLTAAVVQVTADPPPSAPGPWSRLLSRLR